MKNYAVLAAIACTMGATAHAQSLTLFGIIDQGVEVLQTGSASRQVLVTGNNLYGSRIGVRGKEDLGGGLSATFRLEMGILPDTGALSFGGRGFGIQSSVGLENAKNRLLVGRLLHPLVDVSGFDPQFYRRYSLTSQDPGFGPLVHPDNSIRYSRFEGPFQFDFFHSFGFDAQAAPIGGAAGGSADAKDTAVSIKYENPTFAAYLVYDRLHGPLSAGTYGVGFVAPSTLPKTSTSADRVERYVAAARYTLRSNTFYAGIRHLQATVTTQEKNANLAWAGIKHEISPTLEVAGAVYRQKVAGIDARATTYVASGTYKLSKRTSLYTNASYASNSPLSTVGIGGVPVAPGTSQKGVQVGILHFF